MVDCKHVWTHHQLKNQCRQCQRKSCLAPSSAEEPMPTVSTQVMSGPSSAEEPVPTVSTQVMSGQQRPPKRLAVQQQTLDVQMQTLQAINQLV